MRRRLWMVDLTLLALIVVVGTALKDRWSQMSARETKLLQQMIPNVPAPQVPPLGKVSPTIPENYMAVAEQFLFSRDRNPTVILDPPAPPPPPRPMPSLPLAYGMMDLGSGPAVFLSEKKGVDHKAYRPGEQIGEFKLVAVQGREIVFEWDGKEVRRPLEELLDKSANEPPPPPAARAKPRTTGASQTTSSSIGKNAGPGEALGAETRACVPGDKSPAGTVQDGFRKVLTRTPFGEQCRWEAVKN